MAITAPLIPRVCPSILPAATQTAWENFHRRAAANHSGPRQPSLRGGAPAPPATAHLQAAVAPARRPNSLAISQRRGSAPALGLFPRPSRAFYPTSNVSIVALLYASASGFSLSYPSVISDNFPCHPQHFLSPSLLNRLVASRILLQPLPRQPTSPLPACITSLPIIGLERRMPKSSPLPRLVS